MSPTVRIPALMHARFCIALVFSIFKQKPRFTLLRVPVRTSEESFRAGDSRRIFIRYLMSFLIRQQVMGHRGYQECAYKEEDRDGKEVL